MIEIKSWDGRVLYTAQNAQDVRAAVMEAVAKRADLRSADLGSADLRSANLYGADLRSADLRSADLGAALGLSAERVTPLLMLLDQPGAIRAYKRVSADGGSPVHHTRLVYEVGKSYEVDNANTDPLVACGAGINVATLDWCMQEWESGDRILVLEFTAADIAAIPTATDGKFRLHRCTVVDEKDCAALGLGVKPAEEPAKAAV